MQHHRITATFTALIAALVVGACGASRADALDAQTIAKAAEIEMKLLTPM